MHSILITLYKCSEFLKVLPITLKCFLSSIQNISLIFLLFLCLINLSNLYVNVNFSSQSNKSEKNGLVMQTTSGAKNCYSEYVIIFFILTIEKYLYLDWPCVFL